MKTVRKDFSVPRSIQLYLRAVYLVSTVPAVVPSQPLILIQIAQKVLLLRTSRRACLLLFALRAFIVIKIRQREKQNESRVQVVRTTKNMVRQRATGVYHAHLDKPVKREPVSLTMILLIAGMATIAMMGKSNHVQSEFKI